jgi:hypothetical protein
MKDESTNPYARKKAIGERGIPRPAEASSESPDCNKKIVPEGAGAFHRKYLNPAHFHFIFYIGWRIFLFFANGRPRRRQERSNEKQELKKRKARTPRCARTLAVP